MIASASVAPGVLEWVIGLGTLATVGTMIVGSIRHSDRWFAGAFAAYVLTWVAIWCLPR